jgi:chromosome segregation ATPase
MNTKLIIGTTAAILLVVVSLGIYTAVGNARIARLETALEKAGLAADEAARNAAIREAEAAAYKEKIAYLETALVDIRERAAKQDEHVEKTTSARRGARADYNRARNTRSVAADPAELCEWLARLGHPCEP